MWSILLFPCFAERKAACLPDMSGSDVLKQIREKDDKYYKEVPVVALTAQNGANVREEMLELGFQEYLTKPIKRRYLERCLLEFLPEELIKKVKIEDNKAGAKGGDAEYRRSDEGRARTDKGTGAQCSIEKFLLML